MFKSANGAGFCMVKSMGKKIDFLLDYSNND